MGKTSASAEQIQRLFLEHANRLRGFIFALLADRSAVDDVLHEVLLTATAKRADFTPGTDFLAWTRAIARLKVLEHVQRTGKSVAISDEAWQSLAIAAPEADDAWEPRRSALQGCLEKLAPRARELVNLRYSDERLGMEDIAARVSWSVGAVKVALSRARKSLWDCVEARLKGA